MVKATLRKESPPQQRCTVLTQLSVFQETEAIDSEL